jgi:hypothetical protein
MFWHLEQCQKAEEALAVAIAGAEILVGTGDKFAPGEAIPELVAGIARIEQLIHRVLDLRASLQQYNSLQQPDQTNRMRAAYQDMLDRLRARALGSASNALSAEAPTVEAGAPSPGEYQNQQEPAEGGQGCDDAGPAPAPLRTGAGDEQAPGEEPAAVSAAPEEPARSGTQPAPMDHDEPRRGRFTSDAQFLHEVGYIVSELDARFEYPSSVRVSAATERYEDVEYASDRVLKGNASRFGGWPQARTAAREHYRTCTSGPSCVPPEVRK